MPATNRIDGVYYYFARFHGVNENALALLYALDDGEPHSQKEISREWMIPKTTINVIVKSMVRDGYIRIDVESHTREKALSLTEHGKAYAKTLIGGIYEAEERAVKSTLSRFSPEFAAVLVTVLPQPLKLSGAAVATAMSQVVGGGVPLVYFVRDNSSLYRLGRTRFDGRAVIRACANGSSEFMSNVAMSLVGMLLNLQLLKYAGEDGVAAYGVMMYVSMIFSGAFIGYSIGVAPVVSFHDGAGDTPELQSLLRRSLVLIGCFAVGMTALSQLLAEPLAKIFVGYDTGLLALTVSGFRVFALSFLFMGFAIFASGFFTALNDGLTSALISFLRTFVFEAASVLLLPLLWDVNGIWASIVVAELMAVVLSAAFLILKRKKYRYFY